MIFLKHRVLILGIIFLAGACSQPDNGQETSKPNVLFILADDFGYHDMSGMGSDYYETPSIDRIAREGMVFTDGYANCQVCSPSRASIMSGKFTARHGITDWIGARTGTAWREQGRHNKLLPPEYVRNLPHEYITLPEALKEEGYKTFYAGKWHLGSRGSWPEDHGFDINKGGWDKGSPTGGFFSPFKNPKLEDREPGENLSKRLARETADFIKANRDSAFFAFLSFYAVHAPLQTTREKWSKYRDKALEQGVAPIGFRMGHFLPIRQVQDHPIYGGLVESMDEAIGMVLQSLDEAGLDENTIVIFTSDNGGVAAGDAYATTNRPLRAGKGYQYEGGIREPYFIKVPWMDIAGKESNVPVTGADFYPTLLDLLDLEPRPDEHNDGVSLLPLLKGETIEERPLIWHYPHYGNQGGQPSSIIRLGRWKLIHYYEDGHKELYDLETDISEENDLSGEHPDRVERLNERLFNYLEEVGARYPEEDPMYDPELEEEHLEYVRNELMPQLEEYRLKILEEDYDPGNNWWGSEAGNE